MALLKLQDIPVQSMRLSPEANSNLTYLDWNDKIAKHFFNPDKSGIRVWFSVERELIDEIAKKNGVNFENFIEAVKKGPDCINRPNQGICSKASAIHKNWRERSFEYPPYIAYLALFVLAVNHDGDNEGFSENNYYGRLKDMVKENLTTTYFQKTVDLWDDLETWSLKDKKSNFGEFRNDTVGKKFYVGIPQYQAVLKIEDKKKLPDIFWKMGWDSDSNPTEQEILQALKKHQQSLSNQTSNRIERGKPDFLSILTDRVLEELRDYDENEQLTEDDEASTKRGTIEICLDIDTTAQSADFYFRCKRKSGLPEETFTLKHKNSQWEVDPSSSIFLSQKIKDLNVENWEKDFSAISGKYAFHYKGEKYKIFTPADQLDARGWISGQRFLPSKLFYLAVHNSLADKVRKWGQSECDKCYALDDIEGLSREWRLFEIEGVKGDKLIKSIIPALSIDQKQRIQFKGGIRLKRGNQFFNFAPPKIFITEGIEQPKNLYWFKGNELKEPLIPSNQDKHIFSLPKHIPIEEWITVSTQKIESKEKENEFSKKLMLVKPRLKQFSDYSKGLKLNNFGGFNSNRETSKEDFVFNKPYLQGAYGSNLKSVESFQRLPHIPLSEKGGYLIGNRVGEIIVWPKEPFPDSWAPFWIIEYQSWKKFKAHFIGCRESFASKSSFQNPTKEKIQLWRKIIWHYRKRIKPNTKYEKKWKFFLKEVKDV